MVKFPEYLPLDTAVRSVEGGPSMASMSVVKFLYIHSRATNGARPVKGGVTLAVERRGSDGRLLVAMVKCPDHKVFDE